MEQTAEIFLALLVVAIFVYLTKKGSEKARLLAATATFTFTFLQAVEMFFFGYNHISSYGAALCLGASVALGEFLLALPALSIIFSYPSLLKFLEGLVGFLVAAGYKWIYSNVSGKLRFEIGRKSIHMFGGTIIFIILAHFFELRHIFFFLSILALSIATIGSRTSLVRWILEKFERREVFPARGTILFLLGVYVGTLFGKIAGLAGVLALIWLDSTTAVLGLAVGRRKFWRDKTIEGEIFGFLVGFAAEMILFDPLDALLVALFAVVGEVLAAILEVDDNLLIPVFVGAAVTHFL